VWRGRESGGVGVVGGWKRVLLSEMAVDVWRQLAALSTLEGRKQARLPSHEPLPLSTSKQATASSLLSSVHLISTIIEPCYTSSYIDHIISY
jgi:hypothetical protein